MSADPAQAQTDAPTTSSCTQVASDGWTEQEKWIWQRLCGRQIGDLNDGDRFGARPLPADRTSWNDRRVLRGAFLRSILLDEPYVSSLGNRPVVIAGAWFQEAVDLADTKIPRTLVVNDSRFDSDLILRGTDVEGTLGLDGSAVVGRLNVNGAVARKLFLRHARFEDEVDAVAVRVAGNLETDGSNFLKDLNLDGAHVEGALFMRRSTYQYVRLTGSEIAGQVDGSESTFEGELDMDLIRVDGPLFIRDSTLDAVRMIGADVAGIVDMKESTFGADLSMNGSRFGSSVFLTRATFKSVALAAVDVVGILDLSGSTFEGLDLRNGTVHVEFRLAHGDVPRASWQSGSEADLRGASVNTIEDTPDAWPAVVHLDGFTYKGATGSKGDSVDYFLGRTTDWYLTWLRSADHFARQPYLQLESALRGVGRRGTADTIAIARLDSERHAATGARRLVSFLHWGTVRYGYKPEMALVPAIALFVVGFFVVLTQSNFRSVNSIDSSALFSFDRMLPIVSVSKANADADLSSMSPWPRRYFYLHRTLGYIVGAFLIASIARITST